MINGIAFDDLITLSSIDPAKVVVFDTETTGVDRENDELLQFSAVDGTGKTLLSTYIKPSYHDSWPDAEAINRISPDMVSSAPLLEEIAPQIRVLFEDASLIVGYNAEFDLAFLARAGIVPGEKARLFDVMKEYAPVTGEWSERRNDWKWAKLTACAEHYGYAFKAHDALEDTLATLHCFKAMLLDKTQRGYLDVKANPPKPVSEYGFTPFAALPENVRNFIRSTDGDTQVELAEHYIAWDWFAENLDNLNLCSQCYDNGFELADILMAEGYGFLRLSSNENDNIRALVADSGYCLDELSEDESFLVRSKAASYLSERGYTLDEWVGSNPGRCFRTENRLPLDTCNEIAGNLGKWVSSDCSHAELAGHIAEAIFDPYEVADYSESAASSDEAWNEAVENVRLQLSSPSGREMIVEQLVRAYDFEEIEKDAFDELVDEVYSIGPVAGYPLGQNARCAGLESTDYAFQVLSPAERDALGEAVREILSEVEHLGTPIDDLVEDVKYQKLCDTSCFDAVDFISRYRKAHPTDIMSAKEAQKARRKVEMTCTAIRQ